MKKILAILLVGSAVSMLAQGPKGKQPRMAPVLSAGYYVNLKGDTIRGEVQSNPDEEIFFYQKLMFKAKGAGKLAEISDKKAKAYGYDNTHFLLVPFDQETNVYLKYLTRGRLNFFEYKYAVSEGGQEVIKSMYYIQDTKAGDEDKALRELTKISQNFYKKDLKPFLKDQAMLWNDLDKFKFDLPVVIKTIQEFNKMYEGN